MKKLLTALLFMMTGLSLTACAEPTELEQYLNENDIDGSVLEAKDFYDAGRVYSLYSRYLEFESLNLDQIESIIPNDWTFFAGLPTDVQSTIRHVNDIKFYVDILEGNLIGTMLPNNLDVVTENGVTHYLYKLNQTQIVYAVVSEDITREVIIDLSFSMIKVGDDYIQTSYDQLENEINELPGLDVPIDINFENGNIYYTRLNEAEYSLVLYTSNATYTGLFSFDQNVMFDIQIKTDTETLSYNSQDCQGLTPFDGNYETSMMTLLDTCPDNTGSLNAIYYNEIEYYLSWVTGNSHLFFD